MKNNTKNLPFLQRKSQKFLKKKRSGRKTKIPIFLSRGIFLKMHFLHPFFPSKRKKWAQHEFSTGNSVDNVDKNPCKSEFSSISTEFSTGQAPSFPLRRGPRFFVTQKIQICHKCTKSARRPHFLPCGEGVCLRPIVRFLHVCIFYHRIVINIHFLFSFETLLTTERGCFIIGATTKYRTK